MLVRATLLAFAAVLAFSAPVFAQADPHHPDAVATDFAESAAATPDAAAPPDAAGCPPTAMMGQGMEAMPMMQMMQSMQLTQKAMMETMQLMQEQMQQLREESER